MRYIYQHIESILKDYDGSLPLSHFLKQYFRQHPKLGSRDRKLLSEMAYCWYRCERGINRHLPFEDRLHAALYLCGTNYKVINLVLPPELQSDTTLSRPQKLNNLNSFYKPANIVPLGKSTKKGHVHTIFLLEKLWEHTIPFSQGMDQYDWMQSMLSQPRMFIRIRNNMDAALKIFKDNNIEYTIIGSNCISLPNGSDVEALLPEQDYVVQDASSQQTGSYFNPVKNQQWWDCCSGAGGKSLLLKDTEPSVSLTVSDTRSTILHNLAQRFKTYGHKLHGSHIIDVADNAQIQKALVYKHYDAVICDVPCTGSGTWARTPEQLYFFDPAQLKKITALQKEIASNAARRVAAGGKMLYITCSVFKEENEDIVNHILKYKYSLTLKESKLINGIGINADSMYIAVLEKKATAAENE